jgi:hypothetical protein
MAAFRHGAYPAMRFSRCRNLFPVGKPPPLARVTHSRASRESHQQRSLGSTSGLGWYEAHGSEPDNLKFTLGSQRVDPLVLQLHRLHSFYHPITKPTSMVRTTFGLAESFGGNREARGGLVDLLCHRLIAFRPINEAVRFLSAEVRGSLENATAPSVSLVVGP